MNKAFLIGRLTKEPDYRQTANTAVCKFTLAVNRVTKETDFISIVCFGKTADFAANYLKKGTKIAVEGRIQTGNYEKDGKKIYTFDVIADSIEFAESKNVDAPQPAPVSEDEFLDVPSDITVPFR